MERGAVVVDDYVLANGLCLVRTKSSKRLYTRCMDIAHLRVDVGLSSWYLSTMPSFFSEVALI